jgi:hypothetical protein
LNKFTSSIIVLFPSLLPTNNFFLFFLVVLRIELRVLSLLGGTLSVEPCLET